LTIALLSYANKTLATTDDFEVVEKGLCSVSQNKQIKIGVV
jgi:hypothetical protein